VHPRRLLLFRQAVLEAREHGAEPIAGAGLLPVRPCQANEGREVRQVRRQAWAWPNMARVQVQLRNRQGPQRENCSEEAVEGSEETGRSFPPSPWPEAAPPPCDAAAEAQAKHDHEGKNQHSDQEATSEEETEEETSPLIPPAQDAPSQVAPSAEDQAEDQGPYQETTNQATTKNNGEDQHSDPDVERGEDPEKDQRPHQEQGWPRRPVCVVPELDDVFEKARLSGVGSHQRWSQCEQPGRLLQEMPTEQEMQVLDVRHTPPEEGQMLAQEEQQG